MFGGGSSSPSGDRDRER
jgi:mitochondrial import inner membrane translocase subunit TIM23